MTRVPLAAVVLAGGASRRMGRDKATVPHPRGGTMVEHTVSAVSRRCAPVFVVAAPGQALPDLGEARVLRDEARGVGPLLATGRGLRAAAEAGLERAFVCAVDMPELSDEVIDQLAGYVGVDVVLPWDGREHYLAGIYRTALADHIDGLIGSGQRAMRALTDSVLTQRVVLEPGPAMTNVNSEADLQALRAR